MLLQEFANVLSGPLTAAVAPLGTTTTDAAVLTTRFVTVTGADATKGVRLPVLSGDVGESVFIYSTTVTSALKVYPNVGGTINAGAADAAFSLTAQKGCLFIRITAGLTGQWIAVLSA